MLAICPVPTEKINISNRIPNECIFDDWNTEFETKLKKLIKINYNNNNTKKKSIGIWIENIYHDNKFKSGTCYLNIIGNLLNYGINIIISQEYLLHLNPTELLYLTHLFFVGNEYNQLK